MSEIARDLADRFQRSNGELIVFAEGLSEEQWRALCPREWRTFGVVVYHIAEGLALITDVARAVATEQPLPPGLVRNAEEANSKNALQATEHVDCTRQETVELLHRNGAASVEFVRGLTNEQLARSRLVWGREATVEALIEHVLIGHLAGHYATLRAASR